MYKSDARVREKAGYPTLAKALEARSSLARKRGKRFKNLRPYQSRGRWFLTKMAKSMVQKFYLGEDDE